MRRRIRLTSRGKYILFRTLAFCAAVGFPAAAALEVFGAKGNQIVITVPAGIGLGTAMCVVAFVIVFRQQVIGTLKKTVGLPGCVFPAIVYFTLLGLEKAAKWIPQFRTVAMWWAIGGAIGWAFSALAVMFGRGELFSVTVKDDTNEQKEVDTNANAQN